MPASSAKIQPTAFKAGIGTLLALAILLAIARTYIRFRNSRRIFVDDYFLFISTCCLIIGTALTYVNLPYIYTQVNVEAGLEPPPTDFIQQLVLDEKIQDAATVFLWTAIFGVKFSFLFLFRSLIRRIRNLTLWWWCVLAVLMPIYVICTCSLFISCPVFGPGVAQACVTPHALKRENIMVKLTTTLDIFTDVLLISIPVILLWRVKIRLSKKIALGSVLCVSIFLIVISIIKVAAVNKVGSQIDTTWGIFWLQAEASVAVILVSLTIFRSFFIGDGPRNGHEPRHTPYSPQFSTSYKALRMQKNPNGDFPSRPSPTFSGKWKAQNAMARSEDESYSLEDMIRPTQEHGISVTHEISTQITGPTGKEKPSCESFV